MSKNRNNIVEIPEEDVIVEEISETEDTVETPTEEVVQKDGVGKKLLRGLKKAGPFALIGGAFALAFALGRTSGSDAAYRLMLDEGSEEETDDDEDEIDSEDISDEETAEDD